MSQTFSPTRWHRQRRRCCQLRQAPFLWHSLAVVHVCAHVVPSLCFRRGRGGPHTCFVQDLCEHYSRQVLPGGTRAVFQTCACFCRVRGTKNSTSPFRKALSGKCSQAGLSESVFRPIHAVAFAGVVSSGLEVERTSHFPATQTFAVTSEGWAAWPCQKSASRLIGLQQARLPFAPSNPSPNTG